MGSFFLLFDQPRIFPLLNLSQESPVTHTTPISRGKRVIYHGKSVLYKRSYYGLCENGELASRADNSQKLNWNLIYILSKVLAPLINKRYYTNHDNFSYLCYFAISI